MTIVMTYTKEDGSQVQIDFEDDVIEIDLSHCILNKIDSRFL